MNFLQVKRVGAHALPMPAYAKVGDSGMDLRACSAATYHDCVGTHPTTGMELRCWLVPPGGQRVIGCGFAFAIKAGFEGQVRPRSSLSRQGIYCALGTIDAGYRGEVGVILENRAGVTFTVWDGDRIAQLVISPVASVVPVEVTELDETERGADGWGSTGVR